MASDLGVLIGHRLQVDVTGVGIMISHMLDYMLVSFEEFAVDDPTWPAEVADWVEKSGCACLSPWIVRHQRRS